MRLNDGPNFYTLWKDLFVRRIYHFEAATPEPRVLDCGSNIGMSILYFKRVYPRARIVGFEPDPAVFPYLKENLEANGLADVVIHRAAVAATEGTLAFYSDAGCGSCLAESMPQGRITTGTPARSAARHAARVAYVQTAWTWRTS